MKISTLLALATLAVTGSAHANSPMPSPVVKYTKKRQTLAPNMRKTTTCTFREGRIMRVTTGVAIRPFPITVDAKYTTSIRNIREMRSIVMAASLATSRQYVDRGIPRPPTIPPAFEAWLSEGQERIHLNGIQQVGPKKGHWVENTRDAARLLQEFMIFNCDEQL